MTKIETPQIPKWYWAAIGSIVGNHYSDEPLYTQCQLAGLFLARADCCKDASACDEEVEVERVLRDLNHLDRADRGGISLGTAEQASAKNNLVIFQHTPSREGTIPKFSILLHCSEYLNENPVPIVCTARIADLQTGKIAEVEYEYPATIYPQCHMHFITRPKA